MSLKKAMGISDICISVGMLHEYIILLFHKILKGVRDRSPAYIWV